MPYNVYNVYFNNINENTVSNIKIKFREWFQNEVDKRYIKKGRLFRYCYLLSDNDVYLEFGDTELMYNRADDIMNCASMFPQLINMVHDINDITTDLADENGIKVDMIHESRPSGYKCFVNVYRD